MVSARHVIFDFWIKDKISAISVVYVLYKWDIHYCKNS